jgi:hypothetical protein
VHEGPFDVFGRGGLAEQTKDLALTDVCVRSSALRAAPNNAPCIGTA